MSIAQQAIRARSNARIDERYKFRRRDATTAAERLKRLIQRERERDARGKKK